MGETMNSDYRGSFWGYLPSAPVDLKVLFERLRAIFGEPSITDELVIFFKYSSDVRLRFTRDGAVFLQKSKAPVPGQGERYTSQLKANIALAEAEAFVRLLDEVGYKKGLFSFSTKYTYTNPLGTFIIRLNHRFGDFFQFFRAVREGIDLGNTQQDIQGILSKLNLSPWTETEHERHLGKAWADVTQECLVQVDGKLHPRISNIIVKYEYSKVHSTFYDGETLQDAMTRVSNDYSDLEDFYRRATNSELLHTTPIPYSNSFQVTGSIIIPVYRSYDALKYTLKSICKQDLTPEQFNAFEVIVVDDGSPMSGLDIIVSDLSKSVIEKGMTFHMIRSFSNRGRAIARNLGASIATGNILFFLDADVVLAKNYLKDSMVRHQFLNNIVLVGFKQNLSLNDASVREGTVFDMLPDIMQDFRFNKEVKKDWIGLYPVNNEGVVQCVEETNYFKDFGLGKTVGPFDLACMVVSHNMSLRRRQFDRCGGFDQRLSKRWGFEDTFLGANLIARGNHIIPLMSTGVFHLEPVDEVDVGLKERKYNQMGENFRVYSQLMQRHFQRDANAFAE